MLTYYTKETDDMKLKIRPGSSYKIGVDEIEGLSATLAQVMRPIQEAIKAKVYWNDCDLEDAEYKSRDGFIASSENLGGPQLHLVIPKCEEYEFSFLEFGECDGVDCDHEQECMAECDGHFDASLRVWLKLESLDEETGEMSFWLYMGGGNGDAPYFRHKHETTLFEAEFTAKTLAGIKLAARKPINDLLKVLGAK